MGPVVPGPLPPHDGTDVGISVLPGGHLLGGPAWLAPLTPGHRSYCVNWGLTVSPTLSARVPGEDVRVPVLPAWSVLECDVIGVDNLNLSRRLSHWVLTPVQPAHGAVVCPDCDLLPV